MVRRAVQLEVHTYLRFPRPFDGSARRFLPFFGSVAEVEPFFAAGSELLMQ